MKNKLFAGAFAFLGLTTIYAQKGTTTINGSADMFYKYDFNRVGANDKTSFTNINNNTNSFELGMVSAAIKHQMGKGSAFADVGFGNRVKDFSYNDKTNSNFFIKQLFLSYDVNDKLKLTMGSWITHVGYELVNAGDNKNYSMSYAFTNGPFLHTGLKGEFATGKFNFMLGVTNPTDFKSAIDAKVPDNKYVISQIGYADTKTKVYLNSQFGSNNGVTLSTNTQNVKQFDLVVMEQFSDKFSGVFNATTKIVTDDAVRAENSWYSLVGYLNYDIQPDLGIAYRIEYLNNKDYVISGVAKSVVANTISLNYKAGNLTIVPEIRLESAGEKMFKTENGSTKDFNGYFVLGAHYKL